MDEEDIDEYLYGKEAAHAVKSVSFVPKHPVHAKKEQHVDTTQQQPVSSLYTDLDEEPIQDEEITKEHEDSQDIDQQDEEDIEIVLNDVQEPQEKQLMSISTSKPSAPSGQPGVTSPLGSRTAAQQKDLVIYGVPEYEGQSIFNVDLDTIDDKPWRKPGTDITDYFNYGFDEYTWRQYCYKQKMMKDENLRTSRRIEKPAATPTTRQFPLNTQPLLPPPPPPPRHIMSPVTAKDAPPPPPPVSSSSIRKNPPLPHQQGQSYDRQYKPQHDYDRHRHRTSRSRSRSPSRER